MIIELYDDKFWIHATYRIKKPDDDPPRGKPRGIFQMILSILPQQAGVD